MQHTDFHILEKLHNYQKCQMLNTSKFIQKHLKIIKKEDILEES